MSNENLTRNNGADKFAVLAGLLMMDEPKDEVKHDPLYDRLTLILDPLEQFASMLEKSNGETESEVILLENLLERVRNEIKKLTDSLEEQVGGRIEVVFKNKPYLYKGFEYSDIVGFQVEGKQLEGGRDHE
jgi:hypothetical protein